MGKSRKSIVRHRRANTTPALAVRRNQVAGSIQDLVDGKVAIHSTGVHAVGNKQSTKKEKLKEKRAQWLQRNFSLYTCISDAYHVHIGITESHASTVTTSAKKKGKAGALDFQPTFVEALPSSSASAPSTETTMDSISRTPSHNDATKKQAHDRVASRKGRKHALMKEIVHFQSILHHPAYKQDPLGAITQHIKNTAGGGGLR